MRYLSEDNKVFNTIEDCEKHEKEILNEETRKRDFEKRKEAKRKEVDDVRAKYSKVLEEYIKEFEPDYFDLGQKIKKLFNF